jgi:hypothetical protein
MVSETEEERGERKREGRERRRPPEKRHQKWKHGRRINLITNLQAE